MHEEDARLVAAAARFDERARRELVGRLLGRVRSTVMYLAARSPDVDDMTQRALIEVLGSCSTYRGESPLESWAASITTRTVMRLIKQRRTAEAREQAVEVMPEYPEWSRESQAPAEASDQRSAMALVLARLPEERREAMVLKHVHGYSVEEIAVATNTKVNTVRDRLRVARAELRAWLSAPDSTEGGDR